MQTFEPRTFTNVHTYREEILGDAQDLLRAAHNAGSHFFDKGTMRFFSSRLCAAYRSAGNRCVFITSDRTGFDRSSPKAYTVRVAYYDDTYGFTIDDIGEKFGHKTLAKARKAALAAVEK